MISQHILYTAKQKTTSTITTKECVDLYETNWISCNTRQCWNCSSTIQKKRKKTNVSNINKGPLSKYQWLYLTFSIVWGFLNSKRTHSIVHTQNYTLLNANDTSETNYEPNTRTKIIIINYQSKSKRIISPSIFFFTWCILDIQNSYCLLLHWIVSINVCVCVCVSK